MSKRPLSLEVIESVKDTISEAETLIARWDEVPSDREVTPDELKDILESMEALSLSASLAEGELLRFSAEEGGAE